MPVHQLPGTIVALFLFVLSPLSAMAQEALLEPDNVYRVQPGLEDVSIERVPPNEIRPGLAYLYYNQQLGRHVWGIAEPDGSFRYAFGEGTIIPTDALDLRISEELKRQIIERGAPGLQKMLDLTGASPSVRLGADGQWDLLPARSGIRVFDQITGHRWELHGGKRKAVLHTYGDRWRLVDGRFVPATGPVCIPYDPCSPIRAGSAMLVMRTSK